MPRDVLGLDPYQASAVSCAKRGAILAALLTLGAIGLTVYGLNGGGELYTYLGATSFGTSVLSFCLANRCARHTTPPTQSFPSVSPTGVPRHHSIPHATHRAALSCAAACHRRLNAEDIRWADVC